LVSDIALSVNCNLEEIKSLPVVDNYYIYLTELTPDNISNVKPIIDKLDIDTK